MHCNESQFHTFHISYPNCTLYSTFLFLFGAKTGRQREERGGRKWDVFADREKYHGASNGVESKAELRLMVLSDIPTTRKWKDIGHRESFREDPGGGEERVRGEMIVEYVELGSCWTCT